jgi:hypothetical protein
MAAIYLDQFVTDVRRLTQDYEAVLYSDEDIIGALNIALLEVSRLRPDVVSLQTVTWQSESTALSTAPFPAPDNFYSPVLNYVAGWVDFSKRRAMGEDESKALYLLQSLSQQLIGGV